MNIHHRKDEKLYNFDFCWDYIVQYYLTVTKCLLFYFTLYY